MLKSQMPSFSSYQGVSMPGDEVIISEAIISTTSISGLTYFFISFSPFIFRFPVSVSGIDYSASVVRSAFYVLNEALDESFVICAG